MLMCRCSRSSARVVAFTMIVVLSLGLVVLAPISEAKNKKAKQLCLTFDELPVARSFGDVDREAVNYLILDALKRHEVKATGFVVGEQIEDSFDILGQWLNGGHKLGNLTWAG